MQVRQGNPLFAERPRGESRWNELGHHLRSAATHIALLGGLLLAPAAAHADVITVTTTQPGVNTDAYCSLQEAIYSANFDANTFVDPGLLGQGPITVACAPGNGDDVIVLAEGATYAFPAAESSIVDDPFNYMGPTATPIVFTTITIEGNGAKLERPNVDRDFSGVLFRAFAVGYVAPIAASQGGVTGATGTGKLTIRNLFIRGFEVKGGDGGSGGGGGGMGAGGAIYVHAGELHVESSTFEDNGAKGGRGGFAFPGGDGGGGGGGGLAGAGGRAGVRPGGSEAGGAGGGGARGNGSDAGYVYTDRDGWTEWRAAPEGGNGGGTLSDGGEVYINPVGGYRCGGRGGTAFYGEDGSGATCFGGGGGGGRASTAFYGAFFGDGGNGDYGGGGGGGGWANDNLQDFDSAGGKGGFGGGGGAGSQGADGGSSAFGGGGGTGGNPGEAGTFGGNASSTYGGGGAALGGAIFGHDAFIVIENSTFAANYVLRGESPQITGFPDHAEFGQGRGGAVFLVGGELTIRNATLSANESTSAAAAIYVYHPQTDNITRLTKFALYNTIIANSAPAANVCMVHPDVQAEGAGNLIQANATCPGVATTGDPLLGPLQLNAPGLTPTMAIGTDSAAYNMADDTTALSQDQRGVLRPQALNADIGAFEYVRPSADLAISKTTTGPAVAGQYLSYVIDVVNFGPTPAQAVTLTDVLPAGVAFSSVTGSGGFSCTGSTTITCTRSVMQASDLASLTITVFVPASTANGAVLTNTVSIASSTRDPNSGNNSASVATTVRAEADVEVTITGPTTVTAGTEATYAIRVLNYGPSQSQSVAMNVVLPSGASLVSLPPADNAWTCSVSGNIAGCSRSSALPPGVPAAFTLRLRAAASIPHGTQFCTLANVSMTTPDPVLTNTSSSTCATVQASADVALTQAVPTTSGRAGRGTATFSFSLNNAGPSDSRLVSFTARSAYFSGVQPSIAAQPGTVCSVVANDVTCSWPSMAVSSTNTVTITVPWRSALGDVCASGQATAGTSDPNATNNQSAACVPKRR